MLLQRDAGHIDAGPDGHAGVAVLANNPAVDAAGAHVQALSQLVAEAVKRKWDQ